MAKIRVGVIGCGGIAQIMHLPYITETPAFELAALADTNAAVLDAVADRYHIARRFADWRELLALGDLDAVLLAHSGSHRDTVIAALEAGKHVFVEKPLTWNRREAEDVARAASAAADRVVQIGYHKLYDPGFSYARDRLAEFEDLAFVDCTVLHAADGFSRAPYPVLTGDGVAQFNYDLPDWATMQRNSRGWFTTGADAALTAEAIGADATDLQKVVYGLLTVSVIHQIYTLFGFLGEPVRVLHASAWRGGHSMNILIEFANDVRCALNWHELPHLNDYRETYSFYGNKRRMTFELPGPYYRNFPSPVTLQGGDGELSWEKRVTVSYREAFHNELLAFADSIANRTPPTASVADAVRHARFIEQIVAAMMQS